MRLKAASLAQINHPPTPALASVLPVLVENFAVHNGDCQKQNNAAKSFAFQHISQAFYKIPTTTWKSMWKQVCYAFLSVTHRRLHLYISSPRKSDFFLFSGTLCNLIGRKWLKAKGAVQFKNWSSKRIYPLCKIPLILSISHLKARMNITRKRWPRRRQYEILYFLRRYVSGQRETVQIQSKRILAYKYV